ncbi:hypothetical protein M9Y10_017956 [Tritrichomonas musculus]|uniref:Wntless-like transmembrane domain-containing protein n=1 Tax=Tritrichomonas musculus TaxID=1915356 RepID=A0ABR2HUW5_9EUKA
MKNSPSFSSDSGQFFAKNILWINATKKKNLISTIIIFILLFLSLIYFCFYGYQDFITNKYQNREYHTSRTNDQEIQKFDFDLTPFDYNNRFVRFSITFGRNTTGEFSEDVIFYYFIQKLKPYNSKAEKIEKNVSLNAHMNNNQNWTSEYILYRDYVLDFQFLSLGILINKSNTAFNQFEFSYLYGGTESTFFNLYFRSAFSFLHILLLILVLHKKKTKKFKNFLPEQLLFFPLIIITIISNNPFCLYKFFYPTKLYYKWMLYTLPISDSVTYFTTFMLFIFYSYRVSERQNREIYFLGHSKSGKNNFRKVSKFLLILCLIHMFVLIILNYYLGEYLYFNYFPTLKDSARYQNIQHIKSFVIILFSTFVLLFTLVALLIINVVAFPLFLYISSYVVVFVQNFLFEGIFPFFGITNDKEESYIVMSKMIIQNIYCLFIVYIHWPCGEHELDSQSLDDNCIDNDEDKLLNKASSDDLSSYLRS